MQGSYHDPNWSEQVTIPAIEGAIGALKINITSINADHLRDRVILLYMPEPMIAELAGRVRFTVRLAEPLPLLSAQSKRVAAEGDAGQKVPIKSSSEQVSEQALGALQACSDGPQSKAEILMAMGLSSVYVNYQRHVVPLLERGLLERTIPDKPNSHLQKYRLTSLGRALRVQS